MSRQRFSLRSQSNRRRRRERPEIYRRPRFELLESRWVLSAPTLAAISDVTLYAGAPLHIALDGFDSDGDTLTYSVSSTNSALTTTVPQGNRSMKISVAGYGDMKFELFEDLTPRTTGRIIQLAQSGFYNGLKFHRVIDNFMIQGGDPLGTGSGGSGVDFDDEFHPDLQHTSSGILSMAKGSDDTNDSQFFITDTATRHLDFNHNVFGFLTEGDSVRNQINSVPTTTTTGQDPDPDNPLNRPLTPVVMSSVTIFEDRENGVLRLSAPEGTTGQADVTVTVSDGNGGTAQRTFHVTIQPDTSNAQPYLLPISPVQTTADTQVSFPLSAVDLENDSVFYWDAVKYAKYWNARWVELEVPRLVDYELPALENPSLQVEVDPWSGQVTVTPGNGLVGVYGIAVGVATMLPDGLSPNAAASKPWDTQVVPVYIAPKAPTGIQLLASADTGVSSSDGITHLDNTAGKTLRLLVSGTVTGAEVSLYADGNNLIGTATATSNSVTIESNGSFDLSDGVHSITAVQKLLGQEVKVGNLDTEVDLVSQASSPLQITVDTAAPVFTSSPVLGAGQGTEYVYDAQASGESSGQVRYQLTQAPAGMIVDLNTGRVTWTPTSSQGGSHSVTLRASDLAGNPVDQSFQVSVNDAPVIQPIGNKQIQEGQTLLFTASATDTDQPLSFSLEGAPQGATIDAQTGAFTWATTEADGPGQYTITVKVTDATGAAGRESFVATVTENNTSPALASIEDVIADEETLVEFFAVGTDADLPAQELTYRLETGAPAGAAIDAETGRFTWTPGENQTGQYPITVTVVDSLGATASRSFTVTVREVDRPPVFDPVGVQTVAPEEVLQVTVHAADPDLPNPNAVRYSLVDAPDGASIDPQTGELVWAVPGDLAADTYELVVQATEVTGTGQAGASSTLRMQVVVAGSGVNEVLAQMLIAELAETRTDFSTIAVEPDPLASQDAPEPIIDSIAPFVATYENRSLFGTRFAAHGGMHSGGEDVNGGEGIDSLQRSSLRIDGSEDAGDDIDASAAHADPNRQAGEVTPQATDAVMESLAADAASADESTDRAEQLAAAVAENAAAKS